MDWQNPYEGRHKSRCVEDLQTLRDEASIEHVYVSRRQGTTLIRREVMQMRKRHKITMLTQLAIVRLLAMAVHWTLCLHDTIQFRRGDLQFALLGREMESVCCGWQIEQGRARRSRHGAEWVERLEVDPEWGS